MNKKHIFRTISLFFTGLALSSCATLDGERKDIGAFETNFRNSVINSCLANTQISNKKDKSKYCVCFANSYIDRYEENDLRLINNYSNNINAAQIVNVMMKPELKVCEEKFGSL